MHLREPIPVHQIPLFHAVHHLPAHNRRHNLPRELPTIERGVARQRPRLPRLKPPALLGIEDGNVGEIAASQRTAAAQIENSGGADSEKFDDARERNLGFAMELRNRQSQRSLQTSDPKRSTFEFHFLLVRAVRRVSSACCTTGIFSSAPRRKAMRMVSSSRMGLPSSVTATAPARCRAAKSVNVAPREARVAAAIGKTFTTAPRSRLRSQVTHSAVSTTGAVFGMVQTEVKPPAAAAAVPLAIVSL